MARYYFFYMVVRGTIYSFGNLTMEFDRPLTTQQDINTARNGLLEAFNAKVSMPASLDELIICNMMRLV